VRLFCYLSSRCGCSPCTMWASALHHASAIPMEPKRPPGPDVQRGVLHDRARRPHFLHGPVRPRRVAKLAECSALHACSGNGSSSGLLYAPAPVTGVVRICAGFLFLMEACTMLHRAWEPPSVQCTSSISARSQRCRSLSCSAWRFISRAFLELPYRSSCGSGHGL